MLITYRRTGGGFSLLIMLAAAVAVTALTIAVGAVLLLVAVAIGAVALLARALLPTSWRRPRQPVATPWPQETIEATLVEPQGSSERHLLHMDDHKG